VKRQLLLLATLIALPAALGGHHDGHNHFHDVTEESGLVGGSWSGDATVADLNGSGWPSVYLLNLQGPSHYREIVKPPAQPVPQVELSGMTPAVRQQVEAAYRSVATAPTQSAPEAAAGFGDAGKTFLLYALPEVALPCFENAAALAPQDVRWAYYAGMAARQRGDLERARSRFQRALELKTPLPAALIRLGEVEILRNDLKSANRAYTAALAFPGTVAAAHYGLGRVALLRGDARLAAEHFEATLAAKPAASIVHAQLAIAYRRLGQLDKAAAHAAAHGDGIVRFADTLMSQLEADNASNANRVTGAFRELQEGRFAAAVERFRQAAVADPLDARIWLGLGHAQEGLGDAAAAEQSFRRAVEVEPQDVWAHLDLGTFLARRGTRREGIEQLRIAERLRPDLKDGRFQLAQALAQEGRLAEAEAECDTLLQPGPQPREAQALCNQLRANLGKQQPGKQPSPPPR
jgi:tetratricopeptide (TPR) repeat protein